MINCNRLRNVKIIFLALTLLSFVILSLNIALAANNPGHDTLYIAKQGNGTINGSLNITNDLALSNRFYSTYLDIIGNGTIQGSSNRILGTTTALYIESINNVIFNGAIGTANTVYFGDDAGDNVNINITGNAYLKPGKDYYIGNNVKACLSNGSNCLAGTNTGNVSSVTKSGTNPLVISPTTGDVQISITIPTCSGTDKLTYNGAAFSCATDQGASSSAAGGWTNTSTQTTTTLDVSVDSGTFFINSTSNSIGIGTNITEGKLHVASNPATDDLIVNTEATTNLITNPSVETGLSTWGGCGGNTISQSSTYSYTGYYSGLFTYVDSACFTFNTITYAAGQPYIMSLYARRADGAAVTTSDITNMFLENVLLGVASITKADNNWYRVVSNVRTATGSTSNSGIYLNSGRSLYIDAVQVEQKTYVTPYADGSLGAGHSWTGTPHASTSTRLAGSLLTYQTINSAGGIGAAGRGTYPSLRIEQDGTGPIASFFDTATEVLRIADGGNVGIGTASPGQSLTVVGTANITGATYLGNSKCPAGQVLTTDSGSGLISCVAAGSISGAVTGSGSSGYIPLWNATSTINNSVVYQNTTGSIGIGTTTLSEKLTVNGAVDATFYRAGGVMAIATTGNAIRIGTTAATDLSLYAGGADKLFINSTTGYTGIGTTGPTQKLDIIGGAQRIVSTGSGADDLILAEASYPTSYRWKMRTTDRGNAIDLDFYGTDSGDTASLVASMGIPGSGRAALYVNGNIGVGTTTPSQALTVSGTANITGATYLGNSKCPSGQVLTTDSGSGLISCIAASSISGAITGSGNSGYIPLWNATSSINNSVIQQSGGNIGIGVTPSGGRLQITAIGSDASSIYLAGPSSVNRITFDGGTPTAIIGINGVSNFINMYSSGAMTLSPAGGSNVNIGLSGTGDFAVNTNQLYVDTNTGYVGVGTSGPGTKLEVAGNVFTNSENSGLVIDAGGNKRIGFMKYAGIEGALIHGSATVLRFGRVNTTDITAATQSNFTEEMRIDGSGNVGIGTTVPGYKLDISGDLHAIEGAAELKIDHTSGSIITYSGLGLSLASANTILTGPGGANIYMNTGNVGINTSGPSSTLEVSGNVELTNLYDNDATNFFDGGSCAYGIADISSTGAFTCASAQVGGSNTHTHAFTNLTSGTNTVAAMIVGTGASLSTSGSGTINATNSDMLDNLHAANFSREYQATISGISNAGWTNIAYIDGTGLNSKIRMTMGGTTGNVVVALVADMIVNHYQDIFIRTESGSYTQVTLNITSDDNDNFYIQAKTDSANPLTADVRIYTYGGEAVTFSPGSVSGTTSLQHVAYNHQLSISSTGGVTNGMKISDNTVWHAGNDGTGSGLDADMVDGKHVGSITQNYITKMGASSTIGQSVIYDDGTNIGIGTTSPQGRLHIGSTSYSTVNAGYQFNMFGPLNIMQRDSATDSYVVNNAFFNSVGQWQRVLAGGAGRIGWNSDAVGAMDFKVAPTGTAGSTFSWVDGMTILGSGNVGIGTTNPIAKLQVGANTFTGTNGTYADSRIGLSVNGALTSIVYASTYNDPTYPDYGLVFIHGANQANYNVWSISPDGPAKGDSLNFIFQANASNIHSQTPKIVFDGNGNVGIGTVAPSSSLEVNGNAELTNLYDNDGSNFFDNTCTNGIASIDSTGAATCASGGLGDVTGPGSSTDNAITRFDGATGKIIQNSGVTIDDSNNMAGAASVSVSGLLSAPYTGSSAVGKGISLYDLATGRYRIYFGDTTTGPEGLAEPAGHSGTYKTVFYSRSWDWVWEQSDGSTVTEKMYLTAGGNLVLPSGSVTATSFSGSGSGLSSNTVPIASLVAGDYSGKITSGTYSISITGNADTVDSKHIGSITQNYVTKMGASSTIGQSVIYDDGTNIGIGTASPSYKLDLNTPATGTIGNAQIFGAGSNLVRDGSFESWGTSYAGLAPSGCWGGDSATITIVTSNVPNGRQAIRIAQTNSGGGCNNIHSGYIPVQPNTTYTYSFWGKLISGSYGNANNMYVREYNSALTQNTEYGIFSGTFNSSWQRFSYKFTTGPATYYLIADHYNYATGTAEIDGESIQKGSVATEYLTSPYELENNTYAYGNMYVNGNVGIGTVAPSSSLEVNGNVELTNLYDNDGSNFFDLSGCGTTATVTAIDSTGAVTCSAISGVPASSVPFSGITSGTNSAAAMVVGTGASLATSGSGTITANAITSGTYAISISGNAAYSASTSKLYSTDTTYNYTSGAPYYGYLTYDGTRWLFQVNPATPAAVRVAYADAAGNADTVDSKHVGSITQNYVTKMGASSTIGQSVIYDDGTNVGIGTSGPAETLDVSGSFKRSEMRYFTLTRTTPGVAAGDWVNVGNFTNTGVGNFAKFYVYEHNCGTINMESFEFTHTAYLGGSSATWIEMPLSNPNTLYGGQHIALDVYNADRTSTSSPIQVRARVKTAACGSNIAMTILVETNSAFTGSTATGSSASVAAGYLGSDKWQFPVSSGQWSASTEGIYIQNDGKTGIGTTSPNAKLDATATSGSQIRATYDSSNYANFTTDSGGDLNIRASGGDVVITIG